MGVPIISRWASYAALLVLFASVPGLAQAQSPSPDPDSPAGVEYAFPLDQARQQAREDNRKKDRKGTRTQGGAKRPAPLFGAGITKGGSGGGGSGGGGSGGGATDGGSKQAEGSGASGGRSSGEQGDPGSGAAQPAGPKTQAGKEGVPNADRTAAAVSDGGSQNGLLFGVVAGVLLLAGLLGMGLRRGFGRSGS